MHGPTSNALLLSSLPLIHPGYVRVAHDVYEWRGERPEGVWHVLGWLDVGRWLICDGQVRRVTVRKRRWVRADRSETRHSRPPDDHGGRYDALFVAVELMSWLAALVGRRVAAPFNNRPHHRTVQRWLRRALPHGMNTQQAIRLVLIEKSEPRPMELLFPGGLSPPAANRSRWRDPEGALILFHGLEMLTIGARNLKIAPAKLLAEARGRYSNPTASIVLM